MRWLAVSGRSAGPGAFAWSSARLQNFTDAVTAVIITIMALELRVPAGPAVHDLRQRLPGLLIYTLSFATVGMAWNHHHNLFRVSERISPAVMWANLVSLFWLSLVPLVTEWLGLHYQSSLPASAYGLVALAAAGAHALLVRTVADANGKDSAVSAAVRRDTKTIVTIGLYGLGAGLAWISPWIAYALYAGVAVVWVAPDRRFSRAGRPAEDTRAGGSTKSPAAGQ
jgi:uncharacterized membrane protein